MELDENIPDSLSLANNYNTVSDSTFKSLLENCFAALTGSQEIHNMNSLYNSKADLIKELYAALLSVSAQFVRHGQNRDNITQFLTKCNYPSSRIGLYCDLYEKHRREIEACLISIGNHLPHITDVTWKIDYIVKSSSMNRSQGPLFRIGLQVEKFDNGENKTEFVHFSCDSQELQDLVYKLKDAVRHCQRFVNEH